MSNALKAIANKGYKLLASLNEQASEKYSELSVLFKQTADYLCKKYKDSHGTFKKSYDAEVKEVPSYQLIFPRMAQLAN